MAANPFAPNPYESPIIRAELVRRPALPIIRRTFRYCLFFAVLFTVTVLLSLTQLPIPVILSMLAACVLGGLFYLLVGCWQLWNR